MQRTKPKRLLSLLLTLCMVISMASMLSVPAYAAYAEGEILGTTGTGTKEDPVVCNTFDGFKAAMEHSGITFVKLAGIPGGPVVPNPAGPELQTAITQNGPKTLIIEGDTDLYAPLGGRIDSLIAVTNTLSVMGNGRLTFYGGLSNAKNCVLRAFNTNSHITVGGTGNKPILIGKPNGNTYGRAITASMGKVTINDGKFEAHGNAHAVYALELDGDVKAEILGGEFYAENTSSEKANLGLSIQSETADVTIKGGRFTSGIRVHSSKQISDYLPAGYELRAISGDAPIGGNTTAITGGCYVMSAKEINKAVINVTEPAAGANRQDPTIPADSNTSIHNQGWTKLVDGTPQSFSGVFKAGETYRLEVVLVPDTTNGYSFTTNATATINGVTAKIVSSDTTRIHCYRDFKISGTSIQDVAIIVEEPVVGATPATPVTTTTNTTVDTHTWSQGDDPFQSGQARTLTVVVHPTDGDFFSDTVAPTINGKPATIHMKGKDHINCSYEFTVGAPDPVIGHIDVSFTPPAAGGTIEKEVSSYTAAPNCEVTEVQWSPMDGGDWDTFTGGKKYRCTITIVPNEGFFFSSSVPQTTAKFNGIDADVMRIGVNSATYLYDYVISELGHIHEWSTTWQNNGTHHWRECIADGCSITANSEKNEYGEHKFGDWIITKPATENEDGSRESTCSDCSYKATETIPALGHTHSYSSEWSKNETHHWHECSCGDKADNAAHNFGVWTTTKEATEIEDGSRERTCSDCSYKAIETIPALSHTHTLTNHPAKAATQSAAGNTEYWSCTCGKYFSDAAGTTEITLASTVIPKLSGGSGSGSGGGSTTTTPPAVSTAPDWLEQGKASQSTAEAKAGGHSYALTRANGQYGVRAAAWAAFSGYQYWHDTMDGNAVQVRVYVKNPTAITTDLLVSGTVKGPEVEATKTLFEKFFNNKVRAIHLDQTGAWGQSVEIAAKVDLTDMDITKLMIYSYDRAANTYRRIEKPAYWLDRNGYLHFTTSLAGDIVISEGPLALKNGAK